MSFKKLALSLSLLSLLISYVSFETTEVKADIQSPPASKQTHIRKLSRALGNIVYGFSEIPKTYDRELEYTSGVEAFSYGLVQGTRRGIVRFGYGVYELVTFPFALNKKSYRYPLPDFFVDVDNGYNEFPQQIGFLSEENYIRANNY